MSLPENLGRASTWAVSDSPSMGIPLCNVFWGLALLYLCMYNTENPQGKQLVSKYIFSLICHSVIQFQQTGREVFEVLSEGALWDFLRGDDGRNMGKTWDLWLERVLSRRAVTLLHTLLLSPYANFLSHTSSFHSRESKQSNLCLMLNITAAPFYGFSTPL